jgi:hypothetical protein
MALIVAASVALTLAPAASAVNIVQNGSFEIVSDPLGLCCYDTAIGWSDSGGPGIVFSGVEGASDAVTAAIFGSSGSTEGSLWQNLATVTGVTYRLTFDFAAYAGTEFETQGESLRVTAAGLDRIVTDATPSNLPGSDRSGGPAGGFDTYTFLFTATSSTTVLTFSNVGFGSPPSVDGVLDNVSVEAVPAPAAALLCGLGMLAIGLARRRRV